MKKLIVLLMMFMSLLLRAQEKGIKFENGLSWEQVKAKSQIDNKYIFVDCYATWCGPCKQMDIEVYPNAVVGEYMNKRFISVKVQLDTTKNDSKEIQSWYADASFLKKKFKVSAMPTFLFFAPGGQALFKDLGARKSQDFLKMANKVDSADFHYYVLLDAWHDGTLTPEKMPLLAASARKFNDKDTALQIASNYMHQYLDKLPEKDFREKSNIDFMASYVQMISSKDRIFDLYFHHSDAINAIIGDKGFSKGQVDRIISNDEVDPILNAAKSTGKDVDWRKMRKTITKKYDADYAERIIVNARPEFYYKLKDWKSFCKYFVEKIEKYDIKTVRTDTINMWAAYPINNWAWRIFEHSTNSYELKKAIEWSDIARSIDAPYLVSNDMDTKANILYKMGNKEEAIKLEKEADKLNEVQALKDNNKPSMIYKETMAKMQAGIKTWDN